MFGKDKKDKPTDFHITPNTEADERMMEIKRCIDETNERLANAYTSAYSSTPDELRNILSRYTPHTASFTGPALTDVYNLCFEIRNNIVGYMDVLESIAYITKALEARECPVDDCKNCIYYQPGNVEKCDTNRMIAEYLVKGEFVRGIRPKPIDKPKE